ncbi:ABC transporter permease [Alkalicoccobacillus porphyridii]|uniref:ABC transporter permease n=1 Tax=Alkalicoccobacillus porphyridii TaxID=2597270 RepID=A0A553ZUZ4_9BACI|nr:ABC transporter permease [Alkalicoccobacillus porphyridii]TSB45252.1 ABC transporter permease [Alkalicoccobacillus porphyridii]
MKGIVWGLMRDSIRNPWALIAMYMLTIVFTLLLGQTDFSQAIRVPVYSEEMSQSQVDEAVDLLNQDQSVEFYRVESEDVQNIINRQLVAAAVHLQEHRFDIYQARNAFEIGIVESAISSYYSKEGFVQEAALAEAGEPNELRNIIESDNGSYPVSTSSFTIEEDTNWIYDQSLQTIFGFTLFFVIYTITFSITSIIEQKQNGVWDRLILSPASKTSIYTGNLVFGFLLGYVQILIVFLLFASLFQYDFRGGLWISFIVVIPYVFAIVSFGVLLSGLITSIRQLDAIVPFLAVSFAMLGGAFWPIEIVSSNAILVLSYVSPITYGMEMLKGATLYNWSFEQFLLPGSILFFMGTVFMGIGLNLVERRSVS